MWDLEPRRILVATEGRDGDAALRFAAREAEARRCGVHVLHVVPPVGDSGGSRTFAMVNGELHAVGRMIVGEAATKLERLIGPDLPVSTEVTHGTVVGALVAESRHAALVVLQHRGMGPDGRTPTLSVTSYVAARAHAPVVAVPATWREPSPDAAETVSVVLTDDDPGERLVDVAVDEARGRGGALRIARVEDTSEAAEELLADAPETTLYVVGRRHPRMLGHHLDACARTLLRRSPVPVMVVDPDVETRARDLATVAVP